jgi:hypothetical protein
MRLGFRSSARMLPEVSMASMTVASRMGVNMMDWGLAMAINKTAKPSKTTTKGRCLSHRECLAIIARLAPRFMRT